MLRAWKNDSLILDVLLLSAIALPFAFAIMRDLWGVTALIDTQKTPYYYAEAQVVAAILGFLIAAAAILGTGSLSGLQKLKDQRFPLYKRLVQTFAESMFACVLAILFAMIAVIIDQNTKGSPWGGFVGVVLLVLVLARVARAARRLYLSLLL